MSEAEIIIKGELHTSRGDLEEEREILKKGVDHLIFEGSKHKNWEFKLSQYWYAWVLIIFEYLFARILYVDKSIVEDLAEVQKAELQFTRESNTSILENSHTMVKAVSAGIFFTLTAVAIIIGLLGQTRIGSIGLLVSALSPLLLLRVHESRRATVGRDIQIAEMIEETAQDGGRVVVIVGAAHLDGISEALCDELEYEVKSPVYSRLSAPHIKDIAYSSIVAFSVLYVVYSGLLTYVQFFV